MLKMTNIKKSFGERVILDCVNLEIDDGEMIALMGRSGSGKTTLLNIMGLLDQKDDGRYYIDGELIPSENDLATSKIRNTQIGFIVQNYALINDRKISYNISLPLLIGKESKKNIHHSVTQVARKVGIEEHLDKYPYQLSGGECQRAAIARALIKNPQIILADEPTGALDEITEQQIMQLFIELNKQGTTILIATHNKEIASRCKNIYYLSNAKLSTK